MKANILNLDLIANMAAKILASHADYGITYAVKTAIKIYEETFKQLTHEQESIDQTGK